MIFVFCFFLFAVCRRLVARDAPYYPFIVAKKVVVVAAAYTAVVAVVVAADAAYNHKN
jgi:hypothetical protein